MLQSSLQLKNGVLPAFEVGAHHFCVYFDALEMIQHSHSQIECTFLLWEIAHGPTQYPLPLSFSPNLWVS